MFKILRQDEFVPSGEVVIIPDTPPVRVIADGENDDAPSVEEMPEPDEASVKLVESAEELAQRILQNAGVEREKMLTQAREQATQIRERARREGYEQALAAKITEVEQTLETVDAMLEQLTQQQHDFLEQYAEGLHALAFEIAEKVIRKSVTQVDGVMTGVVLHAVASLKNEAWISVEVSDRLPALVEYLKRAAAEGRDSSRIEIAAVDAPEDCCVISTPHGIVDATVSVQLDNLKNLFEKLG